MKQGQYLTSFQLRLLQKSLQTNLRPEYRRRIEIMLLADSGQSQAQICQTIGCSHETARYWIAIAQAGQAHNWHDYPMGRPKAVNDEYLQRLKELVSHSPREYGYAFQRWTAQWLSKQLAKELGVAVSDRHINRLLKEMGLSTRPRREDTKGTGATKDSGIAIGDLHASSPMFPFPLNLIQTR